MAEIIAKELLVKLRVGTKDRMADSVITLLAEEVVLGFYQHINLIVDSIKLLAKLRKQQVNIHLLTTPSPPCGKPIADTHMAAKFP